MKTKQLIAADNIAILGYGKEGQSAFGFLEREGVARNRITILDSKELVELPEGVKSVLGESYMDDLGQYDMIVKTPGISPYDERVEPYREKLVSTTQIFLENYDGKVIAITGTKGKSGTVTLTANGLSAAGKKVALVGNIGTPVLDMLDEIQNGNYDFVVYEMSSFMIESLSDVRVFVAIYVNLFVAHTDWHHGEANYHHDKLRLATIAEHVVVNNAAYMKFKQFFDDLDVACIKTGDGGDYYEQDKEFFHNGELLGSADGMKIIGRHNRNNMCGIIGLAHSVLGVSYEAMKSGFFATEPLKHRLNNIGTYQGIVFFEDSLATTPTSTYQALEAMKQEGYTVGTMLLGGNDQGFDYGTLVENIIEMGIRNLVFFPEAGLKMKKLFDEKGYDYNELITRDTQEAVKFCYQHTELGQVALLSCAAQSFGVWNNAYERGDLFVHYVQELGQK